MPPRPCYTLAAMPFDSVQATHAAAQPRQRTPYQQAVDLQRIIMAKSQADDVAGSVLAQLARAWSELEERKRVLKMKPAPKPIDVSLAQTKKPRRTPGDAAFAEK